MLRPDASVSRTNTPTAAPPSAAAFTLMVNTAVSPAVTVSVPATGVLTMLSFGRWSLTNVQTILSPATTPVIVPEVLLLGLTVLWLVVPSSTHDRDDTYSLKLVAEL